MKHCRNFYITISLALALFSGLAFSQDEKTDKPESPTFDIVEIFGEESFWKIDASQGRGPMANNENLTLHFIKKGEKDGNPVYQYGMFSNGTNIGKPVFFKYEPFLDESNEGIFFDYVALKPRSDNMDHLITYKEKKEDEEGPNELIMQTDKGGLLYLNKLDGKPEKPSCEERGLSEMECLRINDPDEYIKRLKEKHRSGASKFQ